jgi:eukaryotic-like serine/threonine-protein kinase
VGDPIAGRGRVLSLLRADRDCAHFVASQGGSSTNVEVQILLASGEGIEDVHLRFLADARKAAALRGPTLQRILQVGVTPEGRPFVVREAQRGQGLARLLETLGSLATESAVDVALAVCEALESAHAHGVFHGQLDPSHVHLEWWADGPAHVELAGLGTSCALMLLPRDTRSPGALASRAPELRAAQEVDARADVWGVGVLLYTMLAGGPPFAASPSTSDLAATLDEPPMLAGVPDGLAEIVDACLAPDPAVRPRTVTALASRLSSFGTRPVFEKRASLLVVDTGPYDAIVLERLVKEAAPSDGAIEISLEPSASDLAAAAADRTPEPTVVSPEREPSRAPAAPPAPAPAPFAPLAAQLTPTRAPRASSRTMLLVAAACIGFGAVVGALSMRMSSPAPSTTFAATAPPRAPAPLAVAAPGTPVAPSPAETVEEPALPTLAIGDLPSDAPAQAPSRARVPSPTAAKARAASAPPSTEASARAVEPAPAVDPIVRSAAAPIQPKPKASDDDLRRFLDDRR